MLCHLLLLQERKRHKIPHQFRDHPSPQTLVVKRDELDRANAFRFCRVFDTVVFLFCDR